MSITIIASGLILAGTVAVALMNIGKLFDDSGRFIKKKNDSHIEEIIDEKLPQYLQENNKNINEKLDKILEINQEQTRKIEQLEDSNTDMLRREIKKIYGKYRAFKKISQYDKIDCTKLVEDYRAENGNTYVEDLWAEIRTWEVVDSEDEIINNKYHLK